MAGDAPDIPQLACHMYGNKIENTKQRDAKAPLLKSRLQKTA